MAELPTRQRILHEALALFAQRGYEGTTVRDIAEAVGIRDASLYKYYRSKQDIFVSLLDEMKRHFDETVALYRIPEGKADQVAAQYIENDLDFLKGVCHWNFLFFLKDPFASRFRRMLQMERRCDQRAEQIYCDFFLDTPLRFQRELFAEMIRQGFMQKHDPDVMALVFFAPFWLLIDRYDNRPELEAEALARLDRHIERFWVQYHGEGEGLHETQ